MLVRRESHLGAEESACQPSGISVDPGLQDPGPCVQEQKEVESGGRGQASRRTPKTNKAWILAESLAMTTGLLWAAMAVVGAYEQSSSGDRAFPGLSVYGREVGGMTAQERQAEYEAIRESIQAETVELEFPGSEGLEAKKTKVSVGDLGGHLDADDIETQIKAFGRDKSWFENLQIRQLARRGQVDLRGGIVIDEEQATRTLEQISKKLEEPSLPTRLDLENRRIQAGKRGLGVVVPASLSRVSVALRAGERQVELASYERLPARESFPEDLRSMKIDTVLGHFSTGYTQGKDYRDRAHNLKVGAAAVDGTILRPGEVFSFNEIVGPRSSEAGYRYAPGLAGGQVIDVLGGGICQVASTLFAAAFFAGLEVERARPHSRPSSYIPMGLDATVAWPDIDMKLVNSTDKPIVIHMDVRAGKVEAELLGAERPYRVEFSRELEAVLPYREVFREDPELRLGEEELVQQGMRGFSLLRVRKIFGEDGQVKRDEWRLHYPPTSEILRVGMHPEGRPAEKKSRVPYRDPGADLKLSQ